MKAKIVVTLQRDKCIGCNYCVELAPEYFQMSKKDGKTVLIKSTNKKGFHTLKLGAVSDKDSLGQAARACPVKIIEIK